MSALIYVLQDHQVCVAADTLMHDGHEPVRFVTKILVLPHLRGAIAGTGLFELILQWYVTLQRDAVIPDLHWMRDHAPQHPRRLATQLPSAKTTIYHFAWDGERFDGVAFSSAEQYEPRPVHRNSIVVKPQYLGVHQDAELVFQGPEGFAQLVRGQRSFDQELPIHERAEIGGDVHFLSMTRDDVFQTIAYRFPDYDALYSACSRTSHDGRLLQHHRQRSTRTYTARSRHRPRGIHDVLPVWQHDYERPVARSRATKAVLPQGLSQGERDRPTRVASDARNVQQVLPAR